MNLPKHKEVYTPRDFAEWLNITADAVRHHIRVRGFRRNGGRFRYDAHDARRILKYLLTVCQPRNREYFNSRYTEQSPQK